MRVLSEIRGEEVFDVIADIIDPVANIVSDSDVMEYLRGEAKPDGVDSVEFFANRLRKSLPRLLREHKSDIVTILSKIDGVTYDEYMSQMTLGSLMGDVMAVMTDDGFLAFLSSQEEK